VLAIDVGYGQLDWRLRKDERVTVLERTNVRTVDPSVIPWRAEGVVADLAFISLSVALPGLKTLGDPDADFVVLVKPQFELDRSAVGKGGVVRDRDGWARALRRVVAAAEHLSLGVAGATASPVPGPAGNREFFLHLRAGTVEDSERALLRAIAEAPE
jgi:23S rRNA (cytidine1920-2'-O)/16S rRNA (cytidine1409-2'-O)-methyltransferase